MKQNLRGGAKINNDMSDPLWAGTLGDNADTFINGPLDMPDISQLLVEPVDVAGLADPQLFVENSDPGVLRIFQFFAPLAPELPAPSGQIGNANYAILGETLGMEGLQSGTVTISLILKDGVTEICRDEVKVTVVDVAMVEWDEFEAASTPLTPGPNNGDLRMFPGRRFVIDPSQANRQKVAILATVTPVVQGFPVQIRSWDVDDPFDNNNPTMPNVIVIDGDSSGPDNRIPGGGTDTGVGQWTVTTDASGVARVDVDVSMQPGNNYRAGASAMVNGVNDAEVTQADVDDNTPPPPVVLTQMLTIWRNVWLELDSMANGTDITYSGTIDAIFDNDPHSSDGKFEYNVADIDDDGRFEGGTATVPTTGRSYTLIDNEDALGDDYYFTDGLIVGNDLGEIADVVDDDTAVLPKTPDANITLLNGKYQECYIEFAENSVTRDNNNVFVATLEYDDDATAAKGMENADLTPASDLWVAIIAECYQLHHQAAGLFGLPSATSADADPDLQYHIHGTTIWANGDVALTFARVPEVGGRNIALFFLETNMDYIAQVSNGYWAGHIPRALSFVEPRIVAHEIGHMFGLTHLTGTLVSAWNGQDLDLNAEQIDIVRSSDDLSTH